MLRADYGTSTQVVDGARAIAEQAVLSGRLAAHSTPILIDGRPGVAAVMRGASRRSWRSRSRAIEIVGLEVLADPKRLVELGVLEVVERGRD